MADALALAMQLAERAVPRIAVRPSQAEQALVSRASARHLGRKGKLEEELGLFGSKRLVPHLELAQRRVGLDERNSEMKMELWNRWGLGW